MLLYSHQHLPYFFISPVIILIYMHVYMRKGNGCADILLPDFRVVSSHQHNSLCFVTHAKETQETPGSQPCPVFILDG